MTRTWGEKGKRLRILKDLRFEYTYIYGAICPARGIGEAIVINSIGKESMQHHLKAISRCIPENRHAVVVMDKAPWHRSLEIPQNMTVVYLPSYSPELNPQENVWEYLKSNYLSNVVFESLNNVIQACCDAWNALCKDQGRIKNIGDRQWAKLTDIF